MNKAPGCPQPESVHNFQLTSGQQLVPEAIPYEKQPMYTFYDKSSEQVAKDGRSSNTESFYKCRVQG